MGQEHPIITIINHISLESCMGQETIIITVIINHVSM